jgi:hypothetical protein
VPLRKNAKALKIKQHTPQVGVETQLTKHKTMHNKDAEDKNANMKKQAFSKTRIDKDKSFKAATSPATSEVREIRKMEHAALSQVKREVKKAEAEEASLMNARNRGKMDTESSKHTFTNILTKKLEDSTTLKNILSRTEILTNSDRVPVENFQQEIIPHARTDAAKTEVAKSREANTESAKFSEAKTDVANTGFTEGVGTTTDVPKVVQQKGVAKSMERTHSHDVGQRILQMERELLKDVAMHPEDGTKETISKLASSRKTSKEDELVRALKSKEDALTSAETELLG